MIELKIDEEKLHSIESYSKKGGKTVVTPSDLNMIIGKFHMKIGKKETEVRKEIFDYKDEEGQKKFKDTLTKCFEEKDLLKASKKWRKELKNIIFRSFKKVQIGKGKKQQDQVVKLIKLKMINLITLKKK